MSEQSSGEGYSKEAYEASEAKPERTRETEFTDIVEFWKDLGIDVDQADLQEKMDRIPRTAETRGMDWFHYIPKGIKISEVYTRLKKRYLHWLEAYFVEEMDSWVTRTAEEVEKTPRLAYDNRGDSYVIATCFQQEPDTDSLGKNAKAAEEWEKMDQKFMQPIDWLVAASRYYDETGRHLDEVNFTMHPGARFADGSVPGSLFESERERALVGHARPGHSEPLGGVRRVVLPSTIGS